MAAFATTPRLVPAASVRPGMPSTAEEHLRAFVRLTASLREEDVPWWYRGIVYAVQEKRRPKPIFKIEGLETYWFEHGENNSFLAHSRTLSFMRHAESGDFLYEFKNPFTGKINAVTPNVLGSKEPERFTANGIFTDFPGSESKAGPLSFDWQVAGPHVFLVKDRGSTAMPQPWLEAQSPSAPLAEFLDPAVQRLSSFFSSTWFSPFPAWMEMGDIPGHNVWHSTGAKLKSIDDIPAEFLARARADYPEALSARPV
jgi:hypothetical protein